MIITHIIGGLGNQLFQYAMARRITYKKNLVLKLDISDFPSYKIHGFRLNQFNITAEPASQDEIRQFIKNRNRMYLRFVRTYNSFLPFTSRSYVEERFFAYDPETTKLADNIYLEGHWPSEKYFQDIEPVIRQELTLKEEMDVYHQDLKNQIADMESVSMHIRRGDYVTDPTANQVHGTCSLDYYQKAVDEIARSFEKPHFFIFSDDPEWALKNLKISFPMTVVKREGGRDYEDLILMSCCKNHIIANSTFSWWGAWLNPRKDKIVISPAKWYQGADYNTKDLLPGSWITI
jgi:hypothetical protein